MKRRTFMKTATLSLFPILGGATQVALTPGKKFTLQPGSSAMLHACEILGDRIYYLQRDHVSRQYVVGCTTADGSPVWTATLPSGRYSSLAVRPGVGSVLVHHIGFGVEEFDSQGRRLRAAKVWTNNRFHALVGNSLVAARPDNSIEVVDAAVLGTEGLVSPLRHLSAAPSAPSEDFLAVEPLNSREALVIDRASAAMRRVDVKGGVSAIVSWDAPEIKRSLDTYAAKKQEAMVKQGITNLNSVSLPATGHDSSGAVYCLVSPYRLDSALVLELNGSGNATKRIWCTLPDRMLPEYSSPVRIFVAGGYLLIVFTGGGVTRYPYPVAR